MSRLRLIAPVLALAALAAACGGSSNSSSTSDHQPPASTPPSTSTATAPADEAAAKAEITKNWQLFLHSGTPQAQAVALLEKGDTLGPALKKAAAEDKGTGGRRRAKVVSAQFASPTQANVNQKLHAAGQVLNSS